MFANFAKGPPIREIKYPAKKNLFDSFAKINLSFKKQIKI